MWGGLEQNANVWSACCLLVWDGSTVAWCPLSPPPPIDPSCGFTCKPRLLHCVFFCCCRISYGQWRLPSVLLHIHKTHKHLLAKFLLTSRSCDDADWPLMPADRQWPETIPPPSLSHQPLLQLDTPSIMRRVSRIPRVQKILISYSRHPQTRRCGEIFS